MMQNKLSGLVGQSSGYVESLPTPIRRRVDGLKGVQKEHSKLEAQFQEEVLELEKKFFAKFTPLYEKRSKIINGQAEPTEEETGALITLEPKPSSEGGEGSEAAPEPEDAISLSAAVTEVRPGEPIDLSGVYPGGEGATLVVQRLEDGEWVDFADGDVTATVSNETFSTYVITERTGTNNWRVRDTKTDEVSNEVRVQIG